MSRSQQGSSRPGSPGLNFLLIIVFCLLVIVRPQSIWTLLQSSTAGTKD
jgi:hypothetical protein